MGKKKSNELGRSLIKDRFGHGTRKKIVNNDTTMFHTTEVQDGYDWGRLNLQSVTEESSFQDFLRTAELAGTEFQAEKLNISYVNPKTKVGLLTNTERVEIEKKQLDMKNLLKIPRRPKWTKDTTAEELQLLENSNFLEWRRGLAQLQEDDSMIMTPYEKNLDFWRQLWRVVERSDIIVQIVDGRHPLLFRSEDLEKYVKEVDETKMNMILINKSDFLNEEQRIKWAEYFDKLNVRVAFFSAELSTEQAKLEEDNAAEDPLMEKIQNLNLKVDNSEKELVKLEEKIRELRSEPLKNDPNILTNTQLIAFFKNLFPEKVATNGKVIVGLVGYPNVGKSSTINAVFLEKKVSVSATPGKTKHFQTLFVDNELMFCDCPGLVMPSFCTTKADMILNGILLIDQMRDHVPPVNLLCTLIPKHILEEKYGIMIAKPTEGEDPNRLPHSEELLLAYSYNRGFMTANGQPDQSRGARLVLKDFVTGKLLFCWAPPDTNQDDFHKYPKRLKEEVAVELLPPRLQRAMKVSKSATSTEVDTKFFNSVAYVKGRNDFPNVRPVNSLNATDDSSSTATENVLEKPWKHQKREKREKLRRKYAYLDQH